MNRCKKSLSIILALLMVFSVFTVPMTVSAAEVDLVQEDETAETPAITDFSADDFSVSDADLTDVSADELENADLVGEVAADEKEGKDADKEFDPGFIEGEAIVIFKDKMDTASIEDTVSIEDTLTLGDGVDGINIALVSDDQLTADEIVDELSKEPSVKYVMRNRMNRITGDPNDKYFAYQWALKNNKTNSGVADMDCNPETLWSKVKGTSTKSVVAVIDTGIDLNHEDLKSVLWKNTYSQLPGTGNYGYDCTGRVSSGAPVDDNGHGTHCAGIIAAAANNSVGISGINQSNVQIMALKAGYTNSDGEGALPDYAIMKAYDYVIKAKQLGVNIASINCSFGGWYTKSELRELEEIFDKMGKLGIVVCVAAGNENSNIDEPVGYYQGETYYCGPAACESKYCVTVAANDERGKITSFSNYGTEHTDISAPGSSILSTVCYNEYNPNLYDSSTSAKVSKYYQSFNSSISSGQLFYGMKKSSGVTTGFNSSYYFGPSGRSLEIDVKTSTGLVTVPFTIANTTSKYYITFTFKATHDCGLYLFDKAASDSNLTGQLTNGWMSGGEWYTACIEVDPSRRSGYTKSTSRELVFAIPSNSYNSVFLLDDVGISKQGVSESLFGKYSYYQGTSMATPYVAGAAALIATAYPGNSADKIINALYKSAKKDRTMNQYVAEGRILDLKNVASYIGTGTIQPTGVTLNKTSAAIQVGKTVQLTATVSPSNATNKKVTWKSSNTSVATVTTAGLVKGVKAGSANITATTSNGKTATCKVTVTSGAVVQPTGIKLNKTAATVLVGNKIQLVATVSPSNATDKTVTWKSTDTSVATVTSAGLVKGIKAGTAKITAKTSNGKTATCTVTVKNNSSTDYKANIKKLKEYINANYQYIDSWGKNIEVNYTTQTGDGIVFLILDDDDELALYDIYHYSSSITLHSYFHFDFTNNNFDITPVMRYYSSGSTVLHTYSKTSARTYNPEKGFDAVYYYSNDSRVTNEQDINNSKVIFNLSLNHYDAVLDNKLKFGLGGIGFKYFEDDPGNNEVLPTGIKLNKTSANIEAGKKIQLVATVTPSNATNKKVTWKSSNTAVATVTSDGLVKGVKAGTAKITAKTVNGKTATCTVKVIIATPKIAALKNVINGVQITWGKVGGAVKYRVYMKNSNGWKALGDTTALKFIHKAAVSGTKYTYTVRCVTADGSSVVSGIDNVGKSIKYIAAPGLPSLTNIRSGIEIELKTVKGAAKYRIFRKVAGGSWAKVADTANKYYVDCNVVKGKTYYYTVACISSDGKSLVSAYNTTGKAIKRDR